MARVSLSEYVQDFAREASILEEYIKILRSFSDYMYFNVVLSEVLAAGVSRLAKYKAIDTQDLAIFNHSFARVTNTLGNWISEKTYTGGFESRKGMSEGLISRLQVKRKRILITFAEKADAKLESSSKTEIARIVNETIRTSKFSQLLSLRGLSEQSQVDLIVGISSSCCYQYPALLLTLSPSVRRKVIDLERFPYRVELNTSADKEVKAGYKKPVVLDLHSAVLNTYIGFASALLAGLTSKDVDSLDNSKQILQNMEFFLSSTEEMPLPTSDVSEFNRTFNMHSLLQAIKVGQSAGQGRMVVTSIPGDLESRKFFILMPPQYDLFSAVQSNVRMKEYEANPGQFIVQHESEIGSSTRAIGSRKLIAEIERMRGENLIDDKMRRLLKKAGVAISEVAESATVGAMAYIVCSRFDSESALPSAVTAGVLDYLKGIATEGQKRRKRAEA